MKVLIVDDEVQARKLLSSFLERNHTCIVAENVDQALDVFMDESPDVVISDVKLPGKSGLALLWKIQAEDPNVPVILITGHGDKGIAIEAIKGGAFDFLEKPFDLDELLIVVERARKAVEAHQLVVDARERSLESERFATLGVMAGNIAHEVNNHLSIGLSITHRILSDKAPCPEADIKKYVEKISGSLHNIATITKSLRNLAYSGVSYKSTFLIHEIIADAVEVSKLKIKGENIDMRVPDLDDQIKVRCNRVEISQVMVNLLNNAIDAVQGLDEKWIEVNACADDDEWVKIEVIDSGQGLDEDIRGKLFTTFFTTKPIGQGTGLGLMLSKKIIDLHDGELYVDTESSNTKFVVKLRI